MSAPDRLDDDERSKLREGKLDGERALAFRTGGDIRLMTRNRRPLNDIYPELRRGRPQ